MKYSLIIHGGAGKGSKSFFNNIKSIDTQFVNLIDDYNNALYTITLLGKDLLEKGYKAIDVVERCCIELENNELFNAGIGSSKNIENKITHEATIVDGKTLNYGSICECNIIKNPITFSKFLLNDSMILCGNTNIKKYYNKNKKKSNNIEFTLSNYFESKFKSKLNKLYQEMDTVGVVALDIYGNIASGSSTGGLTNRLSGRIGDTHINGVSTIADNKYCGLAVSGCGENIIKHHVASNILYQIKYGKKNLKLSIDNVLKECPSCGIIGIDKQGNIYYNKNTERMFIGYCSNKSDIKTSIW